MGGSFYLCTFSKTVFWDTTKGKEAQRNVVVNIPRCQFLLVKNHTNRR